jgi:BirA family transcriptional regulator, biotin operon repressor / biotin---[acetyl-CoA-carboxylase] ligase
MPDCFLIDWVEETDSTNKALERAFNLESPPEHYCIAAHSQSRGKGMGSNSWESEAGKNLCFSFVVYPHFLEAGMQFLLNQIISLSSRDFIASLLPEKEILIKWPNDIYVDGKKIGGILIENRILGNSFDTSFIGLGLNINQTVFLSDAPNPVSVAQLTGKELPLEGLIEAYSTLYFHWYNKLRNFELQSVQLAYHRHLMGMNQVALYKAGDEIFQAKITGTDEYGRLILQDNEQKLRLFGFKEVSLLK